MGSDEGEPFIYKYDGYTFGPFAGGFKDAIEFLVIPTLPVSADFLA